jgi:glutamine synthetase adenylyltransferase
MLDVYFAARYLQLRDNVPDDDQDRTTSATLRRLQAAASLSEANFRALDEGYRLLRSIDHELRLILGRSSHLPLPEHPAFRDLATRLGYRDAALLSEELILRMANIRKAYEEIMLPEAINDGV